MSQHLGGITISTPT